MIEQQTTAPVLGEATIEEFRASLRGALVGPGDDGYETARRVWNGMFDKRPRLIARCTGVADVISAVQFARSQNLLVAVRGGGHSFPGLSTCDDGLVIDLSPMKGIRVDPQARTARAQPGVTWGEFDRETAAFGLATTGGLVSTTGIAGFTLGGGIGWLMRPYGLTCDNLISADVVTADGRVVTASATENADLFWALRGGGGNFGIVTSFEYRLHPVSMILGGVLFYPAAQAREVLRNYRQFVETAPDQLTTMAAFLTAPPAPFIPAHLQGTPMVGIVVCYAGPIEEGEAAVRSLRAFGPPAVDVVGPMPYTVLQTLFDAGAPHGLLYYSRSDFLPALSDGAIDTLMAQAAAMASPLSAIHLHHMGGAMSRVPAGETAFSNRGAPFTLNTIAAWGDPGESASHMQWVRDLSAAIKPHTTGAVYVNFLGDEGEERVRAAYGASTYDRLAAAKHAYDPTNLFRLNQNIKPMA
jgi:FAD/FMN-containing dehydrogenase